MSTLHFAQYALSTTGAAHLWPLATSLHSISTLFRP